MDYHMDFIGIDQTYKLDWSRVQGHLNWADWMWT